MSLILLAIAGWGLGVFVEYFLHRLLHEKVVKNHTDHHKEFFLMEPADVARRSHPLLEYSGYAAIVFLAMSPSALLLGLTGFLCFYAGVFFHLMVFYQISHFILHDDSWLPAVVRDRGLYKWWRNCHIEHHWHSPVKNYCVTFPYVDMLFGTYVKPRGQYRPTPVKKRK